MPSKETTLRQKFFEYIFEEQEGYLCIAVADKKHARKTFKQSFFYWPKQKNDVSSFLEKIGDRRNVWFSVNLFERSVRTKENALPGNIVWADLDTCSPDEVEPSPNVVIESSSGRFQAIWKLDKLVPPDQAEEYSKRIAYAYNENGADPTGWDLTQLLRVPFTRNFKYENEPAVQLTDVIEGAHTVEEFEMLDEAPGTLTMGESPDVPDLKEFPEPDVIIYKYQLGLKDTAFTGLYTIEPNRTDDWSKLLWRLINICLEAGMSEEETLVISNTAACNKYRRDSRPISYLWRDVLKAKKGQGKLTLIMGELQPLRVPELVKKSETTETFIDQYRDWACDATDALENYHDITAFILLSVLMSGGLYVKTSYTPKLIPNLWALILGDSTLTRKTTAMRMAIDLITEIDNELILATDGSVEGLLSGLSLRPSRASLFYKDEVSGFIDSINRRDYLAGMPETLTHLYDVPPIYTRRLRKETITISNPIFIFFGGGIRDKVYSLLSEEFVLSGFLPRFLVVSGEADISRIRRTGPPNTVGVEKRAVIKSKLADLYETYNRMAEIKLGGGQSIEVEAGVEAVLSEDAWRVYGDIEMEMAAKASESAIRTLALPTFERLSRSILKMSTLLAAERQSPTGEHTIEVRMQDIVNAAYYVQNWGQHSIDLIVNTGKGAAARQVEKVYQAIKKNPGISKSWIMQRHHLMKREMDEILNTLIDRGEVVAKRTGKGVELWAA